MKLDIASIAIGVAIGAGATYFILHKTAPASQSVRPFYPNSLTPTWNSPAAKNCQAQGCTWDGYHCLC